MKKFTMLTAALMLFAFLTLPIGMRGQTRDVETFTFSELGYENTEEVTTVEGDDVTLTFDQGTNAYNAPKYYTTGTGVRMYTGNTLEVALNDQTGETRITAIDFTFAGSYTGSLQNWLGSETSVSFTNTASGQARIQEIAVTFSEGGVAPTTYTVTYNANVAGVNPVVDTYIEGADVTLRASNTFTYDGHTFSEWNTQADGDGDPYDAGDVIENIQANVELYAIWIENTPSDEQWVLTNLADLTEDDVFVIVGNNGSNYAMSNNNGTTSAPAAVAVTVVDDAITSEVAATIQWTISGNATDGYIFYPNGTTTSWLYCTNTNNGVRVGTNANKLFVVNSNYLYNTATSRHIGLYNSQDWRCYSPSSTGVHTNIAGQTFAFYKKVTGGVLPPSISANNVEIAYDATEGSFNFTLNNPVEGGQLSVSEEVDWIDEAEINTLTEGYSVTFTTTANEAGTAREGIVTLTYSYNRSTVTKDVTVTQAGNPNATMTIAEVRAQVTGAVVTTGIVTSCVGTTGYIQDNTAAICVFGASLTVGDEINVSGTLSTYKGLLEITSPVVTVVSQNNTVEPTVKTIAEINADDITSPNSIQGLYVTIENATVTVIDGQNTTIAQGDNTIVVRGISGVEYAVDDVLTLDGNIGCFNVAQIANPQNVEVQQNLEPSITVTPATVNAPAEGADGTLAITYENIPDLISFDYYFCDAEGNELQEDPDWILAEIQEENDVYSVYYVIDANDGEARSAYFKVYTPEADDVYAIVTINQAEYVAPTVASLPFAFDGGRADIENTDGLTQEGLDSDYSSSPKLKFNNTGDWLLLHFNEAPGTLTFDIKGNPSQGSWGGTFKVQTSEDGVTYTDLETYTELTTTVLDDETFDNLGADVRYIKWIYAEKVSGNVALGDIHLYEVGGGPVLPASITVEPATVNATAEETDGTLTVTYENITEIVAEVYFCDAEGGVATYDWIDAEINDDNNVYYVIDANEGEARTAYLKVYALDDNAEDVYSNIVTISQAAYQPPFTGATYSLATVIESGRRYIITNGNDKAMGMQNNNNRAAVDITTVEGVAQVSSADVYEFVINGPDANGNYIIYDANELSTGYLYAASSGSNYLRTRQFNTDANSQWAIIFGEENNAVITAQGDNTRNLMRYNSGSNLFSCYNGGQQPIYLYVKDEEEPTYAFYKDVTGYGEGDGNWFLIASPVDNLDPATTNMLNGNGYDLYAFDQSAVGAEWQNYKTNAFDLAVGQGYLYANVADTTLKIEGTPSAEVEVTFDLVYDPNSNLAGWNLVGNPFGYAATIDKENFYVMNEEGTELTLAGGLLPKVNPLEGIFVKANGENETVTFTDAGASIPGDDDKLSLSVSDSNGNSDFARIRFGEGSNLEKFMLNPENTKIYFTMDNEEYAVVYTESIGEMPLYFKAAANGTYTFTVNADDMEMDYLHLIDNLTGNDIDLLAVSSYSFEAKKSDYANRFKLVYAQFDNIDETSSDAFAFFNNGSFIIANEGNATLQVVDMTGRIVQSETINGTASVSVDTTPGVYMLRLINGDNEKVQKVIVK